MSPAPIAIFAFNRPEALTRLLDSLKRNPEFNDSKTYIFIDGARNKNENYLVTQVGQIAHELHTSGGVEVIQKQSNQGLANSLISGIERVLQENECLIVLEDDLVVSNHFLEFCNSGLEHYKLNLNVASIQGFTQDINYDENDFYFMLGADCWGWATWKNRWNEFELDGAKLLTRLKESKREKEFDLNGAYPYTKMLERQAAGHVDSWAIRWHASMFLQNRVSVYPTKTLVENYGQDGSGTHFGSDTFVPREISTYLPKFENIPATESAKVISQVRRSLRKKYGTYTFFQPMKYVNFLRRKFTNESK